MLIYIQTIETAEDKSKFLSIYNEYRDVMYYIAFQRMQDEWDAEDVIHHAFMKIAENIKIVDPVCPKTRQLVVTMVNNRVTDVLRSRGRHPSVAYDDGVQLATSVEMESEDLLTQCILRLPEKQRTVVWLKYHDGYSLREIAQMLGISLYAAQKIDQRAKKKLEELYLEGGGQL